MNQQALFGTGEVWNSKLGVLCDTSTIRTPIQIPTSWCNPGLHSPREDRKITTNTIWNDALILEGIKSVHCGWENTVFVGMNENLYVIGSWTKEDHSAPVMKKVQINWDVKRMNISQLSCGNSHCLVLYDDGSVYSFGLLESRTMFGEKSDHKLKLTRIAKKYGPITVIAACQVMSVLVGSDSRVYTAGYSTYSCLGRFEDQSKSTFTPEETEVKAYTRLLHENERIISISSGYAHVFALTDKGRAFFHGYSYHGEGGINMRTEVEEPMLVPYFEENRILLKEISCGTFHSLFLTRCNTVYVCGRNSEYQLGVGEHVHTAIVPTLIDLSGLIPRSVISGGRSSFILTDTGFLFAGNLRHYKGDDCTDVFVDFYDYCVQNWQTVESSALGQFDKYYARYKHLHFQMSVGDSHAFFLFSKQNRESFQDNLVTCTKFKDIVVDTRE